MKVVLKSSTIRAQEEAYGLVIFVIPILSATRVVDPEETGNQGKGDRQHRIVASRRLASATWLGTWVRGDFRCLLIRKVSAGVVVMDLGSGLDETCSHMFRAPAGGVNCRGRITHVRKRGYHYLLVRGSGEDG